jgi:ectoine hydroxylase-related dioxygenase (phytanoyl-CoA dioxygenase family)
MGLAMSLSSPEKQQLDEEGFLVLEDFMGAELLAALRGQVEQLFGAEGARAGSEFKQEPGCRRLANLVDKGEVFRQLILQPRLLECVQWVLGPQYKLSSLNARSVQPFWEGTQPLHADMAAVADEQGYWVCNSVWMLDAFTAANGAIRLVPGSHRWRKLPQEALPDPVAPHPHEMLLTGQAGTVVVMNAHLWHGGTANRTAAWRTAVHAFFCRRDKPQQQYQKALLRPELQQRLSLPLRHLLALDDPLNDRVSVAVAVRSGFMK